MVDPKYSFWLGILVTVCVGVGGGTVHLTNALPEAWIPAVVAWNNLLGFIGTAAMTAMAAVSSRQAGPLASAVIIAVAIAFCGVAVPSALAADLISPIAKPRILETYQGSGWYYGLHAEAETQKMTVDPGLGGAFTVGGAVGITLGYMWGANGVTWQALDTMVSYKNVDGVVPTAGDPVKLDSRWSFTQRFKFGGNPSLLLAMLPNMGTLFPALPAPPAGGVGTAHPYFFGAVHASDISESAGVDIGRAWRLEGGFGVGIMQQLGRAQNNPNGAQVVMDLSVEYIPPSSAVMFGLPADFVKLKSGRQTRITAAVLF